MNRRKPKKLLLFFPALLAALLFFFWQPLLAYVVEYSFKSYCRECLQGRLTATRIERSGSEILFVSPKITGIKKSEAIHLQADKLVVLFEPKLLQREIDLHVTLVDPQVDLEKMAPALVSLLGRAKADWGFFKINHKIQIHNGVFDIPSAAGQKKIHFKVDQDLVSGDKMEFAAHFGAPDDETNAVAVSLTHPKKGLTDVSISCAALSCQDLAEAIEVVWPEMRLFMMEGGILDGQISLVLPKHKKPLVKSDIIAQNVSLYYKPFEMRASIPKMHLSYSGEREGFLEFIDPAHVVFEKEGVPFLDFGNLLGSVSFENGDISKLEVDGTCHHHSKDYKAYLRGAEEGNSLIGNLVLTSDFKSDVVLGLTCLEEIVEIGVKNFGPHEFDILQTFLSAYSPSVKAFKMHEGTLEASLSAPLTEEGRVKNLNLTFLKARELAVDVIPWQMSCEAQLLSGNFKADLFAENVLNTLDAQISIENGSMFLEGDGISGPVFTNIKTDLLIEDGVVNSSDILGKFMGLEGQMHIDWSAPVELASVQFSGDAERIVSVLPEKFKKGFLGKFKDEKIELDLQVTRLTDKKIAEGSVKVFMFEPDKGDEFRFGFEFDEPTQVVKANLPRKQLTVADIILRDGYFEANKLKLEKYFSPAIFPEGKVLLKGIGEIKGTFTDKNIAIEYSLENASMESEDFVLEAKSVDHAKHYFDLTNEIDFGLIPLKNGSYFERNSGLLFTDVNSSFEIQDKKIRAPFLESYCNGIYFAGILELDYSSPEKGVFNVDLLAHTMKGKFSQVQHLFSHFRKPFFFLKFPMEGDVSMSQRGGHLHFDFWPGDFSFDAAIHGNLNGGVINSDNFDVSVQELALDFEYIHKANSLDFKDIQGTLLVGKPERVEEYTIAGDHVRFTDISKNQGEFDLWIGDKKRDIIRIAGKTDTPQNAKGNEGKSGDLVQFFLNKDLSHFGDVYPKTFDLILKDWAEIDTFNLELDFKLNTLLHDLQRFSRTGFFFLSRGILKEINDLTSAGGDFVLNLNYDNRRTLLNYYLSGTDVVIAKHPFKKILLNGSKLDHSWVIDQLLLDDLSLSADILHNEDLCKINFLGIKVGSCLLAGLDGEYNKEENAVIGNVNLLEADLARLGEIPQAKAFIDQFMVKGDLKAGGKLRVDFGKGTHGWRAEALLDATLRSGYIKGLAFQTIDKLVCHCSSDKGLVLSNIKTSVLNSVGGNLASLDVGKVEYDLINESFSLENARFKVPSENLALLSDTLRSKFPGMFNESILQTIASLKRRGSFEGALNLDLCGQHHAFRLALQDGDYFFNGQEHSLKSFVLELDPCEFKLVTQYRYHQRPFWVMVNSKSSTLDFGRVVLTDEHPDSQVGQDDSSPLVVYWRNYPETGLVVETAEGDFAGLHFALHRDQEQPLYKDKLHLAGEIYLNVREASSLVPNDLAEKLQNWEIGEGYLLKGKWMVTKNENELENRDVSFKGQLEGHDFEFKGYRFDLLLAELEYDPSKIRLKNAHVSDSCGSMEVGEILIEKGAQDNWQLYTPAMKLSNFRPSKLRVASSYSAPSPKPLVIRQLELFEVKGFLGYEKSFTGNGWFHFANPHKKNLQNTIFAIPAEIISRIGLDLTVLTPVVGTLYFEIRDGKVMLVRSKDVYSEGRLSKFYLPTDTAHESYVDFNGNLNVQVRMKQYNLLFKIAELFTVTVQGTLKKPTYSLNKQQKQQASRSEEIVETQPAQRPSSEYSTPDYSTSDQSSSQYIYR